MRQYCLKTIVTAAIYITLHFCVCLFVPSVIPAEYWVRELIVVKRRLAASILSPRIIFLGGSSTLFGINAREVEAETGLPAMNMGLHAALPLERVLSIGDEVVRSGDVLVLSLEYNFYACGRGAWNRWQVGNALAWDRSYFGSLPFGDRIKATFSGGDPLLMITILVSKLGSIAVPKYYADRIMALAPDEVIWARYRSDGLRTRKFAYSAYNIDDRGDMLGNDKAMFSASGVPVTEPSDVCPDVLSVLSSFVARLKERGVQVIVSHTPYLTEGTPIHGWRESEAHFLRDISSIGVKVLDRREELFLPRAYFFNTSLHLNAIGRRVWTKAVIADLRALGIP